VDAGERGAHPGDARAFRGLSGGARLRGASVAYQLCHGAAARNGGGGPLRAHRVDHHGGAPFNRPTGVAIAPSGEIYIADGYGNARVHRFTAEGELISSWGEPGPGPSQFRLPHHLCVDKTNRVWVADRENSRVQIFREDGKFITQWTDLFRPTAVCIDKDDIVYVSELCMRIR
jgi:sugar lactone lactonase YvrE